MFFSASHNKPKTFSRSIFKGILLLICVLLLTYYAKTHKSILEPVRQHGLLGWSFPHQNGIVSLLILPDDNNDSNLEQNGERIWIGLPHNPQELDKSFVRFAGPRMTILQDSPPIEAIVQASASVDSGGVLLLVGKNLPPKLLLQEKITHLTILQNTPQSVPHLPISGKVKSSWDGTTLQLHTQGFALCYSSTQCPAQDWSLQVYKNRPTSVQKGPRIQPGSDKPTITELFLAPEAYAAAFYQEGQKLQLRKVKLQTWTAQ